MAVKKKKEPEENMAGPVKTIFFNSTKVEDDGEVISLVIQYGALVSSRLKPKQALADFVKKYMPGVIRKLREKEGEAAVA